LIIKKISQSLREANKSGPRAQYLSAWVLGRQKYVQGKEGEMVFSVFGGKEYKL
jgi:hypothetical protein